MTPKEKAQELFENMYYKIQSDELGKDEDSAKECAILAVNEILDNNLWFNDEINNNYWFEVKKEIEKL
jgi:hypothetical protein